MSSLHLISVRLSKTNICLILSYFNRAEPFNSTLNETTHDTSADASSLDVLDVSDGDKSIDLSKDNLSTEIWFHGPISRQDSEALVVNDGDFLVRESTQGSSGQYVLTGMQSGVRKHLLLVDPEGLVSLRFIWVWMCFVSKPDRPYLSPLSLLFASR